ncbi:hypothetical protein APHAL10511_007488 [Amanita phalloides]|nr:hypothetical protein APHAL10511_007488 [Amanita phalloides]
MDVPPQLTPIQKNDWQAAHILYANNIPACLVGPPASAFYGSDDLWIQVVIIVLDPAFEDARNVLLANGYEDLPMDDDSYMMQEVRASGAYGQETIEWRLVSSRHRNGIDIILAPASHWHFNITEDTTIVVDGIRLPKYVSYLEGK